MLRVHCAVPEVRSSCTTTSPESFGDHGERETPGPIPNPEAKPFCADGTAWATAWESRTSPDIFLDGGPLRVVPHRAFRCERNGPGWFRNVGTDIAPERERRRRGVVTTSAIRAAAVRTAARAGRRRAVGPAVSGMPGVRGMSVPPAVPRVRRPPAVPVAPGVRGVPRGPVASAGAAPRDARAPAVRSLVAAQVGQLTARAVAAR